jgi:hypothetical protein
MIHWKSFACRITEPADDPFQEKGSPSHVDHQITAEKQKD